VTWSLSSSVNGRRHRPLFFLLLWGIGFSNRIVTITSKGRHGGAPSPPPWGPLPHIEIETESSQAKPSRIDVVIRAWQLLHKYQNCTFLFPSAVRFARPSLACRVNVEEEGRRANAGAADGARGAAVAPEGIVFRSAVRREDENPAAIKGRDEDGWNVLHCAACYGATLEGGGAPHPAAARELFEKYDKGLHPQNASIEVVEFLLQSYPEALFEKGTKGLVAMHFAAARDAID
jgi:hypothetical protein